MSCASTLSKRDPIFLVQQENVINKGVVHVEQKSWTMKTIEALNGLETYVRGGSQSSVGDRAERSP